MTSMVFEMYIYWSFHNFDSTGQYGDSINFEPLNIFTVNVKVDVLL